MTITQTRLDAMIVEQRSMFRGERLLIDDYCFRDTNRPHNFDATCVPSDSPNSSNPCIFFCSSCNTAVAIHRYGRPFIDPLGRLVRQCMNDGTNRRHTSDSRERCTDKHILLKKYQVRHGISRYRSQMSDPDAQLERERERQERRETTNEQPSDFGPAPRSTPPQRMTDFTERLQRDGLALS